jgi:hypothetical protein
LSLFGVDVSSYQPSDFDVSGLSFAFVKATEGTDYANPKYPAQLATARDANLVVGHYHFAHPGDVDAQVQHFLVHADIKPGEMVAYDWEASGVSQADRDSWIRSVKTLRPDLKVLLYCNRDYWTTIDTESGGPADGLWIADPNSPAGRPNISQSWRFHQYSWSGGIDRDVSSFPTVAALRTWASEGGKAVVADPEPVPAPVVAPVAVPAPVAPPVPALPRVSLTHIVDAARTDPSAPQGHQSYPDDVRPVEAALVAEGLLGAFYGDDGSFGSTSVAAYAEWQRRCGFTGAAANGIPGHGSLAQLGTKHGFEVVN